MAGKGKREQLRVALVLDLDQYEKGLTKAKGEAQEQGKAIGASLGDAVNKVALKFFALDKVIDLAGRAMQGFARTAAEIEQKKTGDAGTAAFAKLTGTIDKLQESFVRTVLESRAAQAVMGWLTSAFEYATSAVENWRSGLDIAIGWFQTGIGTIVKFIGDVGAAIKSFFGLADGEENAFQTWGSEQQKKGTERFAKGVEDLSRGNDARVAAALEEKAQAEALASAKMTHDAAKALEDRRAAFGQATMATIGAFTQSWEAGLTHLAGVFHTFSDQVGEAFGGMKATTVQAVGDVFEAIAFTGPLVERVFGQSSAAAKAFQVVQLGLTGAMALVKGVMAAGKAKDDFGDGNFAGGAMHAIAATTFFSAAALAGVAASRVGHGGGSAVASGITSPERFEEERKTVIVNIDNAHGNLSTLANEIIPELNRAVGSDRVLLATHAQSADRNDPGRFTS